MFQTDGHDPDVLEALFSQKVREIREEIERRTSLGEAVIFGNEAQVRELCGEIREIVESVYSCRAPEGWEGKVFLAVGGSLTLVDAKDLEEVIGSLLGLKLLRGYPGLYRAVVMSKVYPGEGEVTVILPRDLGEGLVPALAWMGVESKVLFLGHLSFMKGERGGLSRSLNYRFTEGRAYMFVESGREVEGDTVNVRGHFEDVTERLNEILDPLLPDEE